MERRRRSTRARWLAAAAAVLLVTAAACGGDDDDSTDDGATDAAADSGTDAGDSEESRGSSDDDGASDDQASSDADAPSGAGGGSLVVGDETFALGSARCYLQEQDAAAGGGKILFVAQGFGTTADGVEFVLDVSRYDENSQFVGDDVQLDIGDPFSDDTVSLNATGEIGTVTVDGSTLSADGLTFTNWDDGTEQPGSFVIDC